jgi:hypothetical protein
MKAELKDVSSNDIFEWDAFKQYRPVDPLDDFGWFTLGIGIEGKEGADYFQVVVATPRAVGRVKRQHGSFPGFTVPLFDPEAIERALKDWVAQFSGPTWEHIVSQLRKSALWEYEGMAGS